MRHMCTTAEQAKAQPKVNQQSSQVSGHYKLKNVKSKKNTNTVESMGLNHSLPTHQWKGRTHMYTKCIIDYVLMNKLIMTFLFETFLT